MRGKRSLVFVFAGVVLFTLTVGSAEAAEFRVKIKSTRSAIPEFTAQEMELVTKSGQDAATGMPSGRRQPQAVTVTKEVGPASSQLRRAMLDNQDLEEVQIEVFNGTRLLRTMKLTNAVISKIETGGASGSTKKKSGGESEIVTFTYQKMEVTTSQGKSTAADAWERKK
jgi:type VI secretion system secreted protein Hcp